ncbi:hypothetical protein EYF80_038386 [Liparis tanakae]|uniref:Uncharacterized protein n=1 Tax=Liparis tanakae TaxID=230148 RepID=A0A4Z2GEU6_9TELE|nr:hypothetical protein EYF80_038386 [Liparis tanakae]
MHLGVDRALSAYGVRSVVVQALPPQLNPLHGPQTQWKTVEKTPVVLRQRRVPPAPAKSKAQPIQYRKYAEVWVN